MFFTDQKMMTFREAVAVGHLSMATETLERVQERKTPKGDALELARTAGVLAAKKTSELIPYCHPIPLDGVAVSFEFLEGGIRIEATVRAIWKTGVEMEALTAVSVAALTLYDMLKPIDKGLEISVIKLERKEGGKSDFKEKIPKGFKAAVIVTSDGTFAGKREDRSGKIIKERLEKFGISDVDYLILPDEKEKIQQALLDFHKKDFSLVLTTGGTGLGPRDVTVEATEAILDREVSGIMEAARSFGQQRTPYSMLSRGKAGTKGKMLIVNLPGSSKGTAESLDAIFPAILHSYRMMAGGKHD